MPASASPNWGTVADPGSKDHGRTTHTEASRRPCRQGAERLPIYDRWHEDPGNAALLHRLKTVVSAKGRPLVFLGHNDRRDGGQ
jgi:hypothetical protein